MKYKMHGSTGLKVSALSFGASSLGSVFKEINEQEGIRTVHNQTWLSGKPEYNEGGIL